MSGPIEAGNPFEAALDLEPRAAGPIGFVVPLSWSLAGFAVSVCATVALSGLGGPDWLPPFASLAGAGTGCVFGFGVARWERWSALDRPAVVDPRGRSRRPVHAAVHVVPAVVGAVAFLGLALMLAWGGHAPWAVAACLAVGAGAVGLLRKVWADHALAVALEAAESDHRRLAHDRLERLAAARWAPRTVRDVARVNLGMLALTLGDLASARRWLLEGHAAGAPVSAGGAGAWASAGRAMLHLLDGALDPAEEQLIEAATGPYGRAVQPQTDAVRLLLVLRRDGEAAARVLGEHLAAPGATPLFLGLLAELRRRAGDEAGCRALLDPATLGALRDLGLARHLPELRTVLAT